MSVWIFLAIAAAAAQTIRSAGQKQLKSQMGDFGASYARFIFALPFAALFLMGWQQSQNLPLPTLNLEFLFWVSCGALTQILFTILLITLFSHRNFAAGTAFSKTEIIQAALFEALLLGVIVTVQTAFAIIIGFVAVLLLSFHKANMGFIKGLAAIGSKQSLMGLGSGAMLGLATVCFRAATDSLDGDDLVLRAAMTAFIATLWQTIVMGAVMLWLAKDELKSCVKGWRGGWVVGITGAIATACWFTAFSLHSVAPVRAVGQIELLITLAVSLFYFKEKISRTEWLAISLLCLSLLLVILD